MKKLTTKTSTSAEIEEIKNALIKTSKIEEEKLSSSYFSFSDAWNFWVAGIVAVLLGYFLFKSLGVVYLILTGFILSMALENVITRFQQWMRRGFGVFLSYIVLIIFVLSGVIIVVPFVIQQLVDIINIVLVKINTLQSLLQNEGLAVVINESVLPYQIKVSLLSSLENGDRIESMQGALLENMSQIVSVGTGYIKNAGGLAVSIIGSLFSTITQVSIVLITAVFFSIEKNKVVALIAQFSGRIEYTELKLLKLYKQLGYRLKGQLMLCLMIGMMTGIGLRLLTWFGIDVSSKFTLALIAGLTEFIPYVGPVLGMFPAVLIGGVSFGRGGIFAVLFLYIIIQQTEGNILVPMVMHHTLGVSPLLIFLCMVLGGSLFGFLGIVLAVPLAVILKILFENYN